MKRLLVAVALAAIAGGARAESPRWGSFELGAGTYKPNIDSEFSTKPGPWEQIFGTKHGWTFRAGVAKTVLRGYAGSLDVGVQAGYFQKTGKGLFTDGSGTSGDETSFKAVPMSVGVTYRFDWLADRYRIPFAPYGRVALERYQWWTTGGGGKTVKDGATNGWSAAGGLAILLDVFDPDLARELDNDSGVNHTYLFAEAKKSVVDDFGSSKSWDLSEENVSFNFGLLFVF